ncbi:hypothetical protein DFQ28_003085 [Apophysomyces sp. BC1034]|nr:hypothetical protein DFQ29_002305 [Apophysomyces sp. BC1021]KAG0189692.1 hypothetical protein DFQ28_003085 [Apophysomyces sp. BC1034]
MFDILSGARITNQIAEVVQDISTLTPPMATQNDIVQELLKSFQSDSSKTPGTSLFEQFTQETIQFLDAVMALAALTHTLNELGAKHWEKFSSANYFDASGLFIVSIYAFPLIINGFMTLVSPNSICVPQ